MLGHGARNCVVIPEEWRCLFIGRLRSRVEPRYQFLLQSEWSNCMKDKVNGCKPPDSMGGKEITHQILKKEYEKSGELSIQMIMGADN